MKIKASIYTFSTILLMICPVVFSQTPPVVDGYRCIKVQGHWLWFNKDFLANEPKLLNETVAAVVADLKDMDRLMPEAAVEVLKSVSIWLEYETEPFGSVTGQVPVYHYSRTWLIQQGKNPAMAQGVQICNAKNYLQCRDDKVGLYMLHEMAHAYFHILEQQQSQSVKAAYELAKAQGIYDKVGRMNSDVLRGEYITAYAMQDEHEYFAELSEAYFGCNDYYPYNRQQLRQHDPIGYQIVRKLWNLPADYVNEQYLVWQNECLTDNLQQSRASENK